jgi:hypothetical protein
MTSNTLASDIDPLLLTLAQLVGIIKVEDGNVKLQTDWFADPLSVTQDSIKNNPDELVLAITQLLGEVGGNALGVPVTDPALLGTWYPLNFGAISTGLYLVSYPSPDNEAVQVIGIGSLVQWNYPDNVEQAATAQALIEVDGKVGPDSVKILAWGLAPIIELGGGNLSLALGKKGRPFSIGVSIEGGDGKKLFEGVDISLQGIKASASIDLGAANPVDLSLVFMDLKLPNASEARDISLVDLAALPANEILSTIAAIAVSALSQLGIAQDKLAYVLPAFGLAGNVPGASGKVPNLDWVAMAQAAANGGNPSAPLLAWFAALLDDTSAGKAWLYALGQLIGTSVPAITGSGSRNDPLALVLSKIDAEGSLLFTLGYDTNAQGTRQFYPGLSFNGAPKSLGGNGDYVLVMSGQLELGQMDLTVTGDISAQPGSLRGQAGFVFQRSDPKVLLFDTKTPIELSVGHVQAGIVLAEGMQLQPAFQLINVTTADGQYATLDLLKPEEIAQVGAQALITEIVAKFKELLGIDGSDDVSFGSAVGVIIGLTEPSLPDGGIWPVTPPLSAAGLLDAIQDPITAVTNYYSTLLSTNVGDKLAFTYLVEAMGTLLAEAGGPKIDVGGSGTRASPWRVSLANSPVGLLVFQDDPVDAGDTKLLTFGLDVNPKLAFTALPTIDLNVTVHLVQIGIGGVSLGSWLPLMSAGIKLPEKLETPSVLGAKVTVDGASLDVSWGNLSRWSWNMKVDQPAIVVGEDTLAIGQDLVFSDTKQLAALMTTSNFASLLVRLLGLFIARTTQPAAIAMNGVLGMLPNLGSHLPKELHWPEGMPVLTPANFDDPIGDLQAQLRGITSVPENLKAATGLLAWAITNGQSVPKIAGKGDINEPLRLPLDFAAGFDLLIFEGTSSSLGLGLGRKDTSEPVTGVNVVTDIQILAVEVPLGGGSSATAEVPSLQMSITITSTSGSITTYQGKEVHGFVASVTFSLDKGLVVTPATYLVTSEGLVPLPADEQAYFTALNAVFAFAIEKLKDNKTFQKAYLIFAELGLVLTDNAGISTEGWNGLFANPLTWLQNGIANVLINPKSRADLFSLMQQMLGINLPTLPNQVLEVLSALGFLTSEELGYAPVPEALIKLASSPVNTLINATTALLTDETRLAALITRIAGSDQGKFGVFTWRVVNGNNVQINIANPVTVGSALNLSAGLTLDLSNGIVESHVNIYVPQVRLSVVPKINWQLGQPINGESFNVNIVWGDGSTPSAPELTLYPLEQSVFLSQLTAIGPAQAVSSFVSMVMDEYLIKPYPLASVFMQGLGLLVKQGDELTFKSLLGLFDNPLDWLLSGSVFGADGTLNVNKIGDLLGQIPTVSGNGISVKQLPAGRTGVSVTGLPYDLVLNFEVDNANTDDAVFVSSVQATQKVSDDVALLTLTSSVTLDRTFQPGIAGALKIEQSSTEVYVETGFDKGFALSLGQTQGVTLNLVPFGGWQALIEAATAIAVQALIKELTGHLIKGLADTSAGDFVKRLEVAGGKDQLDVQSLVTALSKATTPETVLSAALEWLSVRLTKDGAPGTAKAIVTLLTDYIPGTVTTDEGLVSWVPSANLPVTLLSGRDTAGLLGFWAEVDFPATGLLDITVSRTGVGVDPANDFAVNFSFGIDVQVPVVIQNSGPALLMKFDSADKRFSMLFDPQRENQIASPLQVEFLPTFFKGVKLETWLVEVLKWVVPRYGSLILFNLSQVRAWLDTGIVDQTDAPTPADLLTGGGLIEEEQGKYLLKSFTQLMQLTPQTFIGGFLSALLNKPLKVLDIGTDGGIYFERNKELGFGVRLQAPDILVNALPYVTFQLGATNDTWIEETKAPGASAQLPGLAAYLPISDAPSYTPDFASTSIVLSNIGLDIHGKNQAPLVTVSRLSLQEISPRGLLQLTFNSLDSTVVGGSLALNNLGWALSPNALPQGSDINPVAANLMGSGSEQDSTNPPTDPRFSAIVAYSQPGQFWAGLVDASNQVTTKVILPIQQSFGPLNVQQVDVLWENPDRKLGVGFTGGLDLSALSITVFDLTVSVDVSAPLSLASYDLDLQGLAVSFNAGSVNIAGGLVKQDSGADTIYNGAMNIKVGRFGLSAVGSYGLVTDTVTNEKFPSFFVFAASGFPLGGPPSFFVKGFSGGFAYNRSLILPQPDEVQDFILVKAASDPDSIFGKNPTPSAALSKMSEVIKPDVGSYWLAAGVHFTSYAMLDTTALAIIEFGNSLVLSLIGVSTLSQPPLVASKDKALMFAQLGLMVTANITQGSLSARAQLTPNSFVLDQACKLTGGFAFTLWWSPNQHSGDFCITLGGYNANYDAPDYYPVVPRLGLRWPMSGISILGEAYFALTPNAIMAGGRLELEFKAGPLSAWFKANADFIIAWKPFYYNVDIAISIGAAFTTKLFGTTITLKAEIGAALQLWGPPTSGLVTVNWYVISFSIPIGDQNPKLDDKPIGSWALFAKNFLPPDSVPTAADASDAGSQEVLKLQIPRGLIKGQANTTTWTMQRIGFVLRADSAVPGTKASAGNLKPITSDVPLGVRPMDISQLVSELSFSLSSGGKPFTIDSDTFDIISIEDNSPMGLWATTPLVTQVAPATGTVIPKTLVAAAIVGERYKNNGELGPADLAVFDTESISDMDLPLTVNAPYTPAQPQSQTNPIQRVMDTIMQADIVDLRNQILTALQARSLAAPLNPDLNVMAAQADNIFQAPPVLAELSQTLAVQAPKALKRIVLSAKAIVPEPELVKPRCLGGARRYAGRLTSQGAGRFARRAVCATWVGAATLGDTHLPTIRRGTVALWALDTRASHSISCKGKLGIRVFGFDKRLEPAYIHDNTTECSGQLSLPSGLDHAVVCGVDNRPDIAGWQRGSKLVRVNARYLLGDDCLIKPQAVLRRRGLHDCDVCAVDHMLDLNEVEHTDGRCPGWVTTWLPGHHDRACVLLEGESDDMEYAVIERDSEGRLVRRLLDPLIVDDQDLACQIAVFDISNLALDGWVRLMVRAGYTKQLCGVYSHVNACENQLYLGGDAHCMNKLFHTSVSLTLQGES